MSPHFTSVFHTATGDARQNTVSEGGFTLAGLPQSQCFLLGMQWYIGRQSVSDNMGFEKNNGNRPNFIFTAVFGPIKEFAYLWIFYGEYFA